MTFDAALAEIFDEPGEMEEIRRQAALLRAGVRLGEIRERLGMTQAAVADRMGIARGRLAGIETARVPIVEESVLVAYVEALGVSPMCDSW